MVNKNTKIKVGFVFNLFSYTLNTLIKIKKIEYLVDGGNRILEKEPNEIKNGERAFVIIQIIQKTKYFYSVQQQSNFFDKYIIHEAIREFFLEY